LKANLRPRTLFPSPIPACLKTYVCHSWDIPKSASPSKSHPDQRPEVQSEPPKVGWDRSLELILRSLPGLNIGRIGTAPTVAGIPVAWEDRGAETTRKKREGFTSRSSFGSAPELVSRPLLNSPEPMMDRVRKRGRGILTWAARYSKTYGTYPNRHNEQGMQAFDLGGSRCRRSQYLRVY
jgi:hypothetical protein